jgi:hypothetical protein
MVTTKNVVFWEYGAVWVFFYKQMFLRNMLLPSSGRKMTLVTKSVRRFFHVDGGDNFLRNFGV